MGFLQQFHLAIMYKKNITNKVVACSLSRPTMTKIQAMDIIKKLVPFTHKVYGKEYLKSSDFKEVYQ